MKKTTLEQKYTNVPTYIEKSIKKLFKLKSNEIELVSQIKDFMITHNIPVDTPLHLLKYIPDEQVDPNQVQFDLEV